MSTILNGVIEVYDEYAESWYFVIDTHQIFYQNYDIFGLLFDVRNYIEIEAISPKRGLPRNIANTTKQKLNSEYDHDFSYITYTELKSAYKSKSKSKTVTIETDENGMKISNGFFYREKIDFEAKEFYRRVGNRNIWKRKDKYYINSEITAKEILESNKEFNLLINILDLMIGKHKKENIRWVVSFTT